MPSEGQDGREHVAEKYGTIPEQSQQSRAQMTELDMAREIEQLRS